MRGRRSASASFAVVYCFVYFVYFAVHPFHSALPRRSPRLCVCPHQPSPADGRFNLSLLTSTLRSTATEDGSSPTSSEKNSRQFAEFASKCFYPGRGRCVILSYFPESRRGTPFASNPAHPVNPVQQSIIRAAVRKIKSAPARPCHAEVRPCEADVRPLRSLR
jgi:hypothetical protein